MHSGASPGFQVASVREMPYVADVLRQPAQDVKVRRIKCNVVGRICVLLTAEQRTLPAWVLRSSVFAPAVPGTVAPSLCASTICLLAGHEPANTKLG